MVFEPTNLCLIDIHASTVSESARERQATDLRIDPIHYSVSDSVEYTE